MTASAASRTTVTEKGEFTVVLGPFEPTHPSAESLDEEDVRACFYQMTKSGDLSRRQALAQTAKKYGLSTNDLYAMLERLKAVSPP